MSIARHLLAAAALGLAAPALAQSALTGTWKIDPAAAQLPDKPVVRELKGGVYSCKSCNPPTRMVADGKPHAVSEPTVDMRTVSIVDANTIRSAGSLHGKPMYDNLLTVAPDGNTVTVAYQDMSGSTGVVTGTSTQVRVGPRPAGAHAISGAWRETAYTSTDNGLIMTITDDGKQLTYADPTGYGYTATYGGPPVPVHGDAAGGMAQVTRVDANTVRIAGLRGGKLVFVNTVTVAPDGHTVTMVVEDKRQNSVSREHATKQ